MEAQRITLCDIAYFPMNISSHVLPFVGFFAEMESQGLEFDIYGSDNIIKTYLNKFGKNHFGFEELSWKIDEEEKIGLFRAIYLGHLKSIPAIEAIWEANKKKPKLIISDMFSTHAKTLAKKHGIPLLVLYSSYFLPNLTGSWRDKMDLPADFSRDEALAALEREVEEIYGVRIRGIRDIFTQGDQNVSCLSKFIGDFTTLEKEGFTYVGPALRDETKSEILDLDPAFLKDKNLIYVSLGTAGPNIVGFSTYDNIVEAFKNTEHKVLISAAMGKAEELVAKGLPKNIIAKSWVPQTKVLDHSKLFISHVGAGGMVESLSRGVPIIAVPNFADQPLNASVIEKLNVGRELKDKSPEGIKKLVEEVLGNDNIKASCQKHKGMIDTGDAKEKFIGIVRSLIK